jgi:ubiquinone/menaquinone biosynthesis C-methylase UbiE
VVSSQREIFDEKAPSYDEEFSHTLVGTAQRKIIHEFLSEQFKGRTNLQILELNCGTGEDIPVLNQFGKVTATDVSLMMLNMAKQKNPSVEFNQMDLNLPLPKDKQYDLIFSNFGGLNCLRKDRLKTLDVELHQILKPGGRLIVVFISKWSLIEFVYFALRLNFKKAFRRIRGISYFKKLPIYYYSQSATVALFSSFNLQSKVGVGKLLSGEYMNKWAPKLGIKEPPASIPKVVFGADHILFNFIRR